MYFRNARAIWSPLEDPFMFGSLFWEKVEDFAKIFLVLLHVEKLSAIVPFMLIALSNQAHAAYPLPWVPSVCLGGQRIDMR